MFTEEYIKHQEKLAEAQIAFNKKPCRDTATVLSNLREKRVSMYTPEELAKRETMREKANKAFWMKMTDLMFDLKR